MPAIRNARTEGFTIGKLSDLTGVNIETIRYYEKIGMLPAPPRTESGRRIYGPEESRILAFIRRSRELGFPLNEVRALLRLRVSEKASCREVREIAAHHLEDTSPSYSPQIA
jgi:MerR family mercuric resistance operon transcriptional regulator